MKVPDNEPKTKPVTFLMRCFLASCPSVGCSTLLFCVMKPHFILTFTQIKLSVLWHWTEDRWPGEKATDWWLTDGLTSQILSFVVSFLGNPALWQTNLFLSVWELFTLYKIVQPKADYKKNKLIHHTWNSYLISHQFLVSVQTLHAYSRGTEACPYCSVAHCLHQQSMMCCSAFACSWLLSAFYFSKGKNCLDFFVYFNRVLC